jgi:magnesium-transporting ATPase (P-type)
LKIDSCGTSLLCLTNAHWKHQIIIQWYFAVNEDGYGIVIRTGDNPVFGQIAFLTNEDRRKSPMYMEINRVRAYGQQLLLTSRKKCMS